LEVIKTYGSTSIANISEPSHLSLQNTGLQT